MNNLPIILASSSPSRLQLLKQVGIIPDQIIPADIDETQKNGETPRKLAERLGIEKAQFIASSINNGIIIGADTVSAVGRRIMHKAENNDDIRAYLSLMSNRRHNVYTGVCVIKKENGETRQLFKISKSIVKFKKLTNQEIEAFCLLGEGIGSAGGCARNGYAESFVTYFSGSFSGIIGLPLCETMNMLRSLSNK